MPGAILGAAAFVGEVLFDVGAPIFLVNAAIAATPFLINTGLSLGLSLAANALLRPQGAAAQASVKPSAGQQAIRQAVPPRWKSYGTVRLAGPVWWFDANLHSASTTSDLYIGIALNEGRIGGFVSYHIDNYEVTINGSGVVQTVPYNAVSTKILTRLGLPTETAYAQIAAAGGFSVATVRGDGVASILGIFQNFSTSSVQAVNYPSGYPRLRATINASVAWDPRDATQDPNDQTTWQWSENPVVCLLTYLLDRDGYAIPYDWISANLAEWKAAADICDEPVLSINAGGYEKRYRLALTYLFTDRPADVLARFLSTCDGRCWIKRDGSVGIVVGRFVRPDVTLTDRDIIEYEQALGPDPLSAIAGVRAQYMSTAHDYREQDADPWPDGQTVMELDQARVAAIDLTAVPSHSQARRLMKREAVKNAAASRGTIRTTIAGLAAVDQRYINLEVAELGLSGTFEVGRFQFNPNPPFECTIEVVQVGAEIDDWDPTTEEGTPASSPIFTVWQSPASGTTGTDASGYTARQIITGAKISTSGDQVRLTFEAPSGITNAFAHVAIVPRSGLSADGTTVPTEITFGGASGFSVRGRAITSDWVNFALTSGIDYLVVFDISAAPNMATGFSDGFYGLPASASWNVAAMPAGSALTSGFAIGLTTIEVRALG